ncbi:MAG: FkbM family methyltransferase [Vicinamibacterales bacterium]
MVPLVRLDSLDVGDRPIALLKIDVEGYEKFVLDGATGLLSRVHCIFIETWEDHFAKYGYSCVDVHARLRAAGFHLFLFQDDRLVPVPPGYVSHQCEDVVGVRDLALFSARTGFTM